MPWPLKRLYDSAVRVSPSRRAYSSSGSREMESVIPYPKMKSVLFQFSSLGVTVAGTHNINIMFSGLNVTDKEMPLDDYLLINYRGKQFWVEKPDLITTPSTVRCSCADFYFTFGYWNWTARALFGPKPRPYKRKTFNRPPRNPGKHAGMCKHIFNALLLMQTSGWVRRSISGRVLPHPGRAL